MARGSSAEEAAVDDVGVHGAMILSGWSLMQIKEDAGIRAAAV
jgi:hypothetical protein